jgi:hypothetical protein
MKRIAMSLIVAALAASGASAQSSYTMGTGNVCLKINWIDHTRAPDDKTIVFYMKDHTAWTTHLAGTCPQLSFNGFSYVATPPEDICGNLQSIRVIRTGAICMMGPFVPFNPPPAQHAGM